MQKKPLQFLLIVIIFISIVGGVGYVWISWSQKVVKDSNGRSNTTSGKQAIDISVWKVYQNEKYGFEIRYPENYKMSTTTATQVAPAIVSYSPPVEITFDIHDNPNLMSLSEWAKSDLVIHDLSINWEPMSVNGVKILKSPILGNMDSGIEYRALIPRHDKIYTLSFSTKAPGTESEPEVFNQILSTFSFIGIE